MKTEIPNQMTLRWGSNLTTSPTIEDVLSIMQVVLEDNEVKGPPELDLYYPIDHSRAYRLAFLPAFHPSEPSRWVVLFIPRRLPGTSLLLAMDDENCDRFQSRTCVGVTSEYCTACLINDDATLRTAIAWFLREYSPCPSLKWIPYDDAVRDADNSI